MTEAETRIRPRNVLFATLSAGSAGLLLIVIVLVRRFLGMDVFGAFSCALSLATIGEALMDFGLHQVTVRSIAREPASATRIFRNSLGLKALPGLGMLVVLGAIAFALWPDWDLRVSCLLMLAGAILRSYLMTIRGVLLGLERFADESLVVIADRVVLVVAVAVSLELGAGLVGLSVAFVLARVLTVAIGLAFTSRHVGRPVPAFETDLWRDLQLNALPLGAFLIVLNVYNYVDTLLVDHYRGFADAGLYSTAYKLYEGATYVPAILASVLTPRLSQLWNADRQAHARLVRSGVALTAGMAVVLSGLLWVFAPLALRLVFSADALSSTSTLRILGLGLVFVYSIWILHAVAISAFEQRLLLITTAMGVVVNTALNLWLIRPYGPEGAAWATVAGEAFTLVVLLGGLRKVWWPAGDGK